MQKKITSLPLDAHLKSGSYTKYNPKTLKSIFNQEKLQSHWIADLDFALESVLEKALLKRIKKSGFAYAYRSDSFFKALQNWYQKNYSSKIEKEEIIFSPGVMTSIGLIIEKFTKLGDGVIIQPPVYLEFKKVIQKQKRKVINNPLILEKDRYIIDFENLAMILKRKENKILILCSPHNPVGRIWTKKEIEKVIRLCAENQVLLISDEIHKDIVLFENDFYSLYLFKKKFTNFLIVTSEAKTFNLASLTDSMIITPNTKLRQTLKTTLDNYYLGKTNALTSVVLESAYLQGQTWLKKLIPLLEKNVIIIEEEIKKAKSKIKLIKPEATYLVWLDFREIFTNSQDMFEKVTKRSGIALNAGHWFGREGARFMRMNIGTNPQIIRSAIQKIIAAAEKN